jgi:hypothetical protein
MSRLIKSFLLVAVALTLCFVVVSLKSAQKSFAASDTPSTFKQVLLQYKGKNVEIGPADNSSGRFPVRLTAIENDYIVAEEILAPTRITYIPFATIHSIKKDGEDKVIIYTK